MNKLFLTSILTILLISCKSNINPVSKKTHNPLEYSMDNNASLILENPEINCISIGVFKDGKTVAKYYGEIDKGTGIKANDNSIFEIASVIKTFTAYITAQAVLKGKINLNDDIRLYLDSSYDNLEIENQPIRIKDILTHTTGIKRKYFSKTLSKIFSIDATENERKAIANYNKTDFIHDLKNYRLEVTPGKKYDYSGFIAPEILAIILEKVYQKPYASLLEDFIFKKAKMNHTSMRVKGENEKYLLNGYTTNNQLVKPIQTPLSGAGGGLKTTVPDLLKYIEFLLEKKNPVVKEMRKPLFFDKEEDEQYGYFWKLGGDTIMMLNGGTGGNINWLILLPKSNSGFTVSFNYNGKKANELINNIASSLASDLINYPKKNAYFLIRNSIFKNPENWLTTYKRLKKENPKDYNFNDPDMLNDLGYELIRQNKKREAIDVFKLLISEFPNLSNAYDSLGEAYFLSKQYKLSLVNYKKALELNPKSKTAFEMIQKLEEMERNL